jgi:hypothetical protein
MTKRALLLAGIALLGSFYLVAACRFFQPDVSERYRACYIDKQLKYWNLKYSKTSITRFNWQDFRFVSSSNFPQLSADGWSPPDTTGLRLINSPASMYLQFDTACGPHAHIIIKSHSMIMPDTSPVEVSVLINNQRAGAMLYGPNITDTPQVFPIPDSAVDKKRKKLTVTFITLDNLNSAIIRIQSITLTAPDNVNLKDDKKDH